MKRTAFLLIVLVANTVYAQNGWNDDPTNNTVFTPRKVGVGYSAPADIMHLWTARGFNLLLGDYASVGTMYAGWSTVIGNNVRAKPTQENLLVNGTSHSTYGGAAIVLNGANGI